MFGSTNSTENLKYSTKGQILEKGQSHEGAGTKEFLQFSKNSK